jgi:RNA polymerase sigma-70 factor (ECF subfamily)
MSQLASPPPDDGEFIRRAEPFRRELLAHCYRMLGSIHEAEDLVQETYLRAWRSYGGFEGRSSLRTWLYQIATNACLTVLQRGGRRPLPAGLGGPSNDPEGPLGAPPADVTWLQPIPDAVAQPETQDPAAIVAFRGTVRLALIASLQYLNPRQRAVLILRDVLCRPAAEVAEILGTTTVAVKSTLQRARARLVEVEPAAEAVSEPPDPQLHALLDQYIAAFENADATILERLLVDETTIEIPPYRTWFEGRATCTRHITAHLGSPGDWRMIPTSANGQPAAASYHRGDDGTYEAFAISVLTATTAGIARIVVFCDSSLFGNFGLPSLYPTTDAHVDPR